ncbi:MAG TPA: DUF3089 domain-containing protein [Acidimicrobiales bacterium]|nr:DUF3089 domain-containing protein [Acidimicrobiales bacterium]
MRGTTRGTTLARAVAALALAAAACSGGGDGDEAGDGPGGDAATTSEPAALPAGWEGYSSATYADDAHWLCKPGIADDVCSRDLDATAVAADGTTEVEPHEAAEDPAVDCFYVYPTVSEDPTPNSDLVPAEGQEINTVYNQAARLTSSCRLYAPVYRQVTLSMIGGGAGADRAAIGATAYGDVVDAFKHYVANDSDGRGFVLIGHSQGAGMLSRLIADEIDGEPLLRDRLVSAYILGSSVHVPAGEVVGGVFDEVPLCEEPDQVGCVVSYATFRATAPPEAGAFFGRASDVGPAACVNPADLAGGPAALHPYFLVDGRASGLLGGTSQPFADPARTSGITTPWVTYPGLLEAECVTQGDLTYLSLTVNGDPADPRTDDIEGDLPGGWGLHIVDANIAMGDIEDLVASQAAAYVG